jgi:hypothetical protein
MGSSGSMSFKYGLDQVDYGEILPQNDNDEETARFRRIYNAFEMPILEMEKTIVGPEIINHLSFAINRIYTSIPYQLLK